MKSFNIFELIIMACLTIIISLVIMIFVITLDVKDFSNNRSPQHAIEIFEMVYNCPQKSKKDPPSVVRFSDDLIAVIGCGRTVQYEYVWYKKGWKKL